MISPVPFRCGPYTVRQAVRISDRLLHYVISRGGKIVGHSYSVPDLGWCAAIERQNRVTIEAVTVRKIDYHLRGIAARKHAASQK